MVGFDDPLVRMEALMDAPTMTDAEAVALLDAMIPTERRIPTVATADEIASVRAAFTIVCPALPEAMTRVFYGESARVLASAAAMCGAKGIPIGGLMSDLVLPFWTAIERAVPMSADELERFREMKRNLQATLHPIAAAHRGEVLPPLPWEDDGLGTADERPAAVLSAPPSIGEDAARDLAVYASLASDEEVEWLAARVLDDHGIDRFGLAMDQVRINAGVAVSVRENGTPVGWMRSMLEEVWGVGRNPVPAVAEIHRRMIDRMCEMASPGWRP